MKKFLFSLAAMVAIASSLSAFSLWNAVPRFFPEEGGCPENAAADWFQSLALDIGWRGDQLDWKLKDLESSYVSGAVDDHILFKDIRSYTVGLQAKWYACDYYVRISADYGATVSGRCKETFEIDSPFLWGPVKARTSDPVKRRGDVYDFDGAIGYPFAFFERSLAVIPLVGFSFHRQQIGVRLPEHSSSSSSGGRRRRRSSQNSPFSSSVSTSTPGARITSFSDSTSSFTVGSDSNPFIDPTSSDPFSSSSDGRVASALGLSNPNRSCSYRFTWYGFYLGADIAYTFNNCWDAFWYTEFHFLNECHRKRKSWTGVGFVDHYHKKGGAYGFDNTLGVTCNICDCWYGIMIVDLNWWKADAKGDDLQWKKVGAKIGLVNAF